MAEVDVEQLLNDLDTLDDSIGSGGSPPRKRYSLQQAKDLDDLTGTLDDLLQLTETGMEEEPKLGPLSRRTLRISQDVDGESRASVEVSVAPGGGEFITPRPPLMPKCKPSPSPGASVNTTPRTGGEDASTWDSPAASAHGSSTNSMNSMIRERMISTDVESELENLLANSQGNSEPSSPIKAKSPARSPVKIVQDNSYGHMHVLSSTLPMPALDVDDFDDSPRCAMVGAAVAVIPPFAAPEPLPVVLSPPKNRSSGVNLTPRSSGNGVSFTPLPVSGIITAANKKKCIRVTINGSLAKRGYKSSSFARDTCCSNLRCIKCNFSVVAFTQARWESTVDYMFFRNANCDPIKLSMKLIPSAAGGGGEGTECAYCCQCSWATSESNRETEVKEVGLEWGCGGHAEE